MDLRDLRGFELDVPGIIDLFGLDRLIEAAGKDKLIQKIGSEEVIETIGEEKVIETIGEEKAIEAIGKEKALAVIFPNLTREQIRELLKKNGVAKKESDYN